MQAAGFIEYVGAGAQIQVVGVAEYYLCLDIVAQFTHVHTFHGATCAHGHENRGFYVAVVGMYDAGTGVGTLRCNFEFKFHIRCKVTIFPVKSDTGGRLCPGFIFSAPFSCEHGQKYRQ